jgi:hypothetical protein
VSRGGQFVVGHSITGASNVTGDLAVNDNGLVAVGQNLNGLTVGGSVRLDTGGRIVVGNDLIGAVNVGGALSVSGQARLSVSRNITGAFTVNGDLNLATGGNIAVGGNISGAFTVHGGLNVASGGTIVVAGNLNSLQVDGIFHGQGSATAVDLTVGLNLGSLTVLGGAPNQGGIQAANIDVGKQILGLNVPHGIFNSFITAGVLIDGGTPGAGGNIGADGTDAIFNSEIRAGVRIDHLTINGNVRSTFATDPNSTGYRTRIVAGEDRAGHFISGGVIDNFQILGTLIDSVLAASVAPYGDSGTLPVIAYGAPPPTVGPPPGDNGFNTYDAPAGTITGGTVGNPIKYLNFSEISYYNETATGVSYNGPPLPDPTIDDTILPGAINPSFATAPLSQAALTNGTTVMTTTGGQVVNVAVSSADQVLPLPSKSTVFGGVISTQHGDNADFAGIFAADTRGVFVGTLPSS